MRPTHKLNAVFVMEQHLGHHTFYRNLRACLEAEPRIRPLWIEVTYTQPGSRWDSVPLLPSQWRGTLVGRAQVQKGLRQAAYDVAFFNTQVPAALGGRLSRRRPYVLCTDITPIQYDRLGAKYGHQPDGNSWLGRHKHRVNQGLFRQAARILAWSNWTKGSLLEDYGVRAERLEVLPPGVDLGTWQPGPARPPGPVRILFVGGDFTRKGGEEVIRAFQTLPAGAAELVLVTRSPVSAVDGLRVYPHLRPNTPELVALYQTCDVFVLPSHAEAFGIAAAEASAMALPVVASDVGGLPDIVAHGETGFVIGPGDWETLAGHLQRLVADPELRTRLGRAARRRAEALFDARRNAARIAALLYEVAGAPQPN
jgi:glycosyltransferase involved in cell wall biosynthesis